MPAASLLAAAEIAERKLAAERETDRAARRALGFGRVAGQFVRMFSGIGRGAWPWAEGATVLGFGCAAGNPLGARRRGRGTPGPDVLFQDFVRAFCERPGSGSDVPTGKSFVQNRERASRSGSALCWAAASSAGGEAEAA